MKSYPIFKILFLILFVIFASNCATTNHVTQAPQPNAPPQVVQSPIIQNISFSDEENFTKIRIEGSEPIAPPFYKVLSDPLRLVIDVPNVDMKQIKEPIKIDNGTVGTLVVTQYDDKGRIEIGLEQMTNYNISREDKVLTIDIERVKKAAETKDVRKEEEPIREKGVELPPVESKTEAAPPSGKEVLSPSAETGNKAKEVVDLSFEKKEDFITFNIKADGKVGNYNAFKLDSPARLVLDLWEVGTRYPRKMIKTENPFIKEVRIGRYPDKVRLVFDSLPAQLPPYQINRVDDRLVISFGNVPQPAEPQVFVQPKAQEGASTKGGELSAVSSKMGEKMASPGEQNKPGKVNTLTGIAFKQMDGKSRIIVSVTEEPRVESYMLSKKAIAVDIKNALASKKVQRAMDTSEFKSAVTSIHIQNIKTGRANDVRVLIKLREEVPYQTTAEGKTLFIDIEGPKEAVAKIESAPVAKKEESPAELKKESKTEEGMAPVEPQKAEKPPETEKVTAQAEVTPRGGETKKPAGEMITPERVYQGRKISLDFKDADIKNILRLIAEVSNLNIITGEDVSGKITMRLVDVPWDQALDVVLQARALGKRQVGNVIRVAPLETLRKEIQAELDSKKEVRKLEDLATDLVYVNYATAKELLPQVKHMLSDRGDVKVDERTNTLIIKDIPKNISEARALVKSLDTKTPQVLIEARIIEANLTFQKELGVQWGLQVEGGKGKKKTSTVQGGLLDNKIVDLPAVPASGAGSAGILEFLFTSQYALKQLDIAISAHENQGNVKIISSPKIVTVDNKEASIEQGLRIPYPKRDETTGNISVEFAEADLKLTVTPQVTNDGNVKLKIKVKKDAPDFSITVQDVPAIDKKEAITEVMIRNTGVVVIGGVYTIQKDNNLEGVPLFNKIPLLGWLFKRESKADTRKDLLIFISPKIVKDEI